IAVSHRVVAEAAPLLMEVVGLAKSYRDQAALAEISFSIRSLARRAIGPRPRECGVPSSRTTPNRGAPGAVGRAAGLRGRLFPIGPGGPRDSLSCAGPRIR